MRIFVPALLDGGDVLRVGRTLFVGLSRRTNAEAVPALTEIETPELDQQLEGARHDLAQTEAALALAKITAGRSATLAQTSPISVQENDQKQSDFALKTATVEGSRANVRRLEELQSFARVTAPFSGIITTRKTDVGDLIAARNSSGWHRRISSASLSAFPRPARWASLSGRRPNCSSPRCQVAFSRPE